MSYISCLQAILNESKSQYEKGYKLIKYLSCSSSFILIFCLI